MNFQQGYAIGRDIRKRRDQRGYDEAYRKYQDLSLGVDHESPSSVWDTQTSQIKDLVRSGDLSTEHVKEAAEWLRDAQFRRRGHRLATIQALISSDNPAFKQTGLEMLNTDSQLLAPGFQLIGDLSKSNGKDVLTVEQRDAKTGAPKSVQVFDANNGLTKLFDAMMHHRQGGMKQVSNQDRAERKFEFDQMDANRRFGLQETSLRGTVAAC